MKNSCAKILRKYSLANVLCFFVKDILLFYYITLLKIKEIVRLNVRTYMRTFILKHLNK